MAHQHMLDAEMNFTDDVERAGEKQIVVLMNTSRQRVLDRNNTAVSTLPLDGTENIIKTFERKRRTSILEEFLRSDFAIRSVHSLKRNSHEMILKKDEKNGDRLISIVIDFRYFSNTSFFVAEKFPAVRR